MFGQDTTLVSNMANHTVLDISRFGGHLSGLCTGILPPLHLLGSSGITKILQELTINDKMSGKQMTTSR